MSTVGNKVNAVESRNTKKTQRTRESYGYAIARARRGSDGTNYRFRTEINYVRLDARIYRRSLFRLIYSARYCTRRDPVVGDLLSRGLSRPLSSRARRFGAISRRSNFAARISRSENDRSLAPRRGKSTRGLPLFIATTRARSRRADSRTGDFGERDTTDARELDLESIVLDETCRYKR